MRISDWSSDVCSSDLNLGDRKLIERYLRGHAGTGIAIPVPNAAGLGGRIYQQHLEPGVTQFVQQIDAAEACTDDHGIVIGRASRSHVATFDRSAIAFAVA